MIKIRRHIGRYTLLFSITTFALLLCSSSSIKLASAHGERFYFPSDLPACNARTMVCMEGVATFGPASETVANVAPASFAPSIPQNEHNCVDGAGIPKSCFDIGPFEYMPQNLMLQKGGLGAAQKLSAIGETPCVDGQAEAPDSTFPCSNVDLLAFMPLNEIGGGIGNDIWGWTAPDGGEYVIMGRRNGTSFVYISDPTNPVYLGDLPTEDGITSLWRDLKVYNNHAFIVVDDSVRTTRSHGMQVFDLTQLVDAATNTAALPISFTTTAVYKEIDAAHNIAINETSGFAYIVGSRHAPEDAMKCAGGLHMVDITTPTAPTFAGCFGGDGYTHDTQCVIYDGPDTAYQDREICFNSNEDSLTIVDVTIKNSPAQIAKAYYRNFCEEGDEGDCNNNGGFLPAFYTHQGWLTEDHTYFVQNDELDEFSLGINTNTYMWNVQDLDNPKYIGNYTAKLESIDHNLYIKDQYIYAANYSSGLRILDASNIAAASLTEIAYFDTYPADNAVNYDGAWSSYPFFESGVVPVSTIREGLFLLRPTLTRAPGTVEPPPTDGVKIYMPVIRQ